MRNQIRRRIRRAWVRAVPGRVFMTLALSAAKLLVLLGFHGLLAAGFGGAEAPVWRLYRRLYGSRS